jgi:hypothetical protein
MTNFAGRIRCGTKLSQALQPALTLVVVPTIDYMRLTDEITQAQWIAERLHPFGSATAGSVVPTGFPAYARLLHPAEVPRAGQGRIVRWAEVARWSGTSLDRVTQFPDIALPEHSPPGLAPWRGDGPATGRLAEADLRALVEVLTSYSADPDRCWFCIWDGYGQVPSLPEACNAPRVRLPGRNYILYTGALKECLALSNTVGLPTEIQTPNLWWPAERSWFVATEIDLAWSYVGGSSELISALIADERLEALPAEPTDNIHRRLTGWLKTVVSNATDNLLDSHEASIQTVVGSVQAWLTPPESSQSGELYSTTITDTGRRTDRAKRLAPGNRGYLRHTLTHALTDALLDLTRR